MVDFNLSLTIFTVGKWVTLLLKYPLVTKIYWPH